MPPKAAAKKANKTVKKTTGAKKPLTKYQSFMKKKTAELSKKHGFVKGSDKNKVTWSKIFLEAITAWKKEPVSKK